MPPKRRASTENIAPASDIDDVASRNSAALSELPPPGSAENPVVLEESPMKTYPPPAVGPNADGMDKQAQNAQTRDEEE